MTATSTKCLYELDEIGEAVKVYWFCSDKCRESMYYCALPGTFVSGINDEWITGTVCDECEKPLEENK